MPPNSGARRPQSNNNNLKTLRANFRQSISTLHELFPEWTQDDLSFVMDECQGDMDLAITRITEGYANQWDQVKSKKPKPQPHQKKPFKSNKGDPSGRVNNNNNFNNNKSKLNGKNQKHKKNKEKKEQKNKTAPTPPEEEQKPSWASILKGPPKPEEVAPQITAPEQKNTEEPSLENSEIQNSEDKEDRIEAEREVVIEQGEPEGTIKEEIEPTPEEKEEEISNTENDQAQEEEQETVEIPEENKEPEQEANKSPVASPPPVTTTIKKPTIRRLNQVEAVVLPSNQQPSTLPTVNVRFGSLNLNNGEEQETKDENEEAVEETIIVDVVQESKQEEKPVVVEKQEEKKEAVIEKEVTPANDAVEVAVAAEAKPLPTPPATTNNNLAALNSGKPLPQAFQPQHTLPPQQQQPMQVPIQNIQQLHPQQIHHPSQSYPQQVQLPPPQTHIQQHNETYAFNPYASYAPNLHTAASGYSMGAPTEYIMYNTEPQRMNYYDPVLYAQSPSLNTSAPHNMVREKYTTGAPVEAMIKHTPPPPPPPQQQPYMGNGNVPYYSYYYTQQQQQQQQNGYHIQQQQQGYQPYVNKYPYKSNTYYNEPTTTPNFENHHHQQQPPQPQPQQQEMMYNKEPMPPQYIYNYSQPLPPQSYYLQQQRQPYWH